MSCTHERYRQDDYMMADNAMKAMKRGEICYIGMTVKICESCGLDISHAKRVQVLTVEQYMRGLEK